MLDEHPLLSFRVGTRTRPLRSDGRCQRHRARVFTFTVFGERRKDGVDVSRWSKVAELTPGGPFKEPQYLFLRH